MKSSLEKLPNEPIIIFAVGEQGEENAPVTDELLSLLDSLPEPVTLIFDLTNFKASFQDMLLGIKTSSTGETSLMRHPKIKQYLSVTDSKALQMIAKGMDTVTFGNIKITVFPTLDEALAHARSQS